METILQTSNFPKGMRVLVLGDDSTCLFIAEKMFQSYECQVTACEEAPMAFDLLRENCTFDVVITDIQIPGMDRFEFLVQAQLEMDMPVLMMSSNSKTNAGMEGLDHGACFYFKKPITINQIKCLWQYVCKERACEIKQLNQVEIAQLTTSKNKALEDVEDVSSTNKEKWKMPKGKEVGKEFKIKRKWKNKRNKRMAWDLDLHCKFLTAVNQLGSDDCFPRKILDLMNAPGVTRANVSSHLQKYRQFVRRIEDASKLNAGNFSNESLESIYLDDIPQFMYDLHQMGFPNTNENSNRMEIQTGLAGNPYSLSTPPTTYENSNRMEIQTGLASNPYSFSTPTTYENFNRMEIQTGLAGNPYSLSTPTKMCPTNRMPSLNQEAQINSSENELTYLQPLLNNHNTHQKLPQSSSQPWESYWQQNSAQPWPSSSQQYSSEPSPSYSKRYSSQPRPSSWQQNAGNPGFQMRQHHRSTGSSSHGYTTTGYLNNIDDIRARLELFNSSPPVSTFNLPRVHGRDGLSSMGRMEALRSFTQIPPLDYANSYCGNQMNNTNTTYNLLDEIDLGKMELGVEGKSRQVSSYILSNDISTGKMELGVEGKSRRVSSYILSNDISTGKMAHRVEGRPLQVSEFSLTNFGTTGTHESASFRKLPTSNQITVESTIVTDHELGSFDITNAHGLASFGKLPAANQITVESNIVTDHELGNFDITNAHGLASFGKLPAANQIPMESTNEIDYELGDYDTVDTRKLVSFVKLLTGDTHETASFGKLPTANQVPMESTNVIDYELGNTVNADTHELASFGELQSSNQFLMGSTNAIDHEWASVSEIPIANKLLMKFKDSMDSENDLVSEFYPKKNGDSSLDVLKSPAFPEQFSDDDLADFIFNQPKKVTRAAESEFDISVYLDDKNVP